MDEADMGLPMTEVNLSQWTSGQAPSKVDMYTQADYLRLRNSLTQVAEELKLRRIADQESEVRIKCLVKEKHELEAKWETDLSRLTSAKQQHDEALRDVRRTYDEKIQVLHEDKTRQQLLGQNLEKEVKSLRDEIRTLQMKKYSLEKQLHDQNYKLNLQKSTTDKYLAQLSTLEQKFTAIERQFHEIGSWEKQLKKEVEESVQLNRSLMYVNKHQTCLIDQYKAEIRQLQVQLLEARSRLKSDPARHKSDLNTLEERVSQMRNICSKKETEIEKLKDDLKLTDGKYKRTVQDLTDSHSLVQRHLSVAETHSENSRHLEAKLTSSHDRTLQLEEDIDKLQREKDIEHLAHEAALHEWTQKDEDLNKRLKQTEEALDKATNAQQNLEERNSCWEQQNVKLTDNVKQLQAILNKEKSDSSTQVEIDTSSVEIQAGCTDVINIGTQINPEIIETCTQTPVTSFIHADTQTWMSSLLHSSTQTLMMSSVHVETQTSLKTFDNVLDHPSERSGTSNVAPLLHHDIGNNSSTMHSVILPTVDDPIIEKDSFTTTKESVLLSSAMALIIKHEALDVGDDKVDNINNNIQDDNTDNTYNEIDICINNSVNENCVVTNDDVNNCINTMSSSAESSPVCCSGNKLDEVLIMSNSSITEVRKIAPSITGNNYDTFQKPPDIISANLPHAPINTYEPSRNIHLVANVVSNNDDNNSCSSHKQAVHRMNEINPRNTMLSSDRPSSSKETVCNQQPEYNVGVIETSNKDNHVDIDSPSTVPVKKPRLESNCDQIISSDIHITHASDLQQNYRNCEQIAPNPFSLRQRDVQNCQEIHTSVTPAYESRTVNQLLVTTDHSPVNKDCDIAPGFNKNYCSSQRPVLGSRYQGAMSQNIEIGNSSGVGSYASVNTTASLAPMTNTIAYCDQSMMRPYALQPAIDSSRHNQEVESCQSGASDASGTGQILARTDVTDDETREYDHNASTCSLTSSVLNTDSQCFQHRSKSSVLHWSSSSNISKLNTGAKLTPPNFSLSRLSTRKVAHISPTTHSNTSNPWRKDSSSPSSGSLSLNKVVEITVISPQRSCLAKLSTQSVHVSPQRRQVSRASPGSVSPQRLPVKRTHLTSAGINTLNTSERPDPYVMSRPLSPYSMFAQQLAGMKGVKIPSRTGPQKRLQPKSILKEPGELKSNVPKSVQFTNPVKEVPVKPQVPGLISGEQPLPSDDADQASDHS